MDATKELKGFPVPGREFKGGDFRGTSLSRSLDHAGALPWLLAWARGRCPPGPMLDECLQYLQHPDRDGDYTLTSSISLPPPTGSKAGTG